MMPLGRYQTEDLAGTKRGTPRDPMTNLELEYGSL